MKIFSLPKEYLPPRLPLWGRWHCEAVTDEAVSLFEPVQNLHHLTRPPFGGTLPRGEGFFVNDES